MLAESSGQRENTLQNQKSAIEAWPQLHQLLFSLAELLCSKHQEHIVR